MVPESYSFSGVLDLVREDIGVNSVCIHAGQSNSISRIYPPNSEDTLPLKGDGPLAAFGEPDPRIVFE